MQTRTTHQNRETNCVKQYNLAQLEREERSYVQAVNPPCSDVILVSVLDVVGLLSSSLCHLSPVISISPRLCSYPCVPFVLGGRLPSIPNRGVYPSRETCKPAREYNHKEGATPRKSCKSARDSTRQQNTRTRKPASLQGKGKSHLQDPCVILASSLRNTC